MPIERTESQEDYNHPDGTLVTVKTIEIRNRCPNCSGTGYEMYSTEKDIAIWNARDKCCSECGKQIGEDDDGPEENGKRPCALCNGSCEKEGNVEHEYVTTYRMNGSVTMVYNMPPPDSEELGL